MTTERNSHFVVISNDELSVKHREKEHVKSDIGYHSNPMYEKLLNYKQLQEKKRFTVDDLLKWC